MKTFVPLYCILFLMVLLTTTSCSRRHYSSSLFQQQTANHKVVAVLPAEMLFTGSQPKHITAEDVARMEEEESKAFQVALYNSILKYANTRRYETTVNIQDFASTQRLLESNEITIRDAWRKDDVELCKLLGVDAIVRMRIRKKRYMSDMTSYGIDVARRIGNDVGVLGKVPLPNGISKTNDIYATCSLVSNGRTLWNNSFKGASNWKWQANEIIENITDNFGRNFPYKQRR